MCLAVILFLPLLLSFVFTIVLLSVIALAVLFFNRLLTGWLRRLFTRGLWILTVIIVHLKCV